MKFIFYRKIIVMALSSCSLVLLASCSFGQRTGSSIQDLLPRETDVPGWAQAFGNSFRSPKRIRLIDGNYPLYNVQAVAFAAYKSISSPDTLINVRVIKCESPLHSFGLFSLERGFAPLRNEKDDSYYTDEGFFFRRGDYYVKLMAANVDDVRKSDLSLFNEIILALIDPIASKEQLPMWIHAFSQNKSLTDLILYKNGSPLLPGVRNLFVRRRIVDKKEKFIFFTKASTVEENANVLFRIIESDPKYIFSKSGGVQFLQKENPEGGTIFLSSKGPWLFGVFNVDSVQEGSRILLTLFSELSGM